MPLRFLRNLFYRGPSTDVLHREYAKNRKVDERAPVLAQAQVDIDAPLSEVWRVLSEVDEWGTWDPGIREVVLGSAVAVDGTFQWVRGRVRISSRFAVVDPERELTWSGVSSGVRAVHRNTMETTVDGRVRLRSRESMAAPLVGVLYPSASLQRSLQGWLETLKQTVEQRIQAP